MGLGCRTSVACAAWLSVVARRVPSVLLATFMPVVCPACGRSGSAPCAACVRRMRRAPGGATPAGLDDCRALLDYEGAARELIARLKYRNDRAALGWLAEGMARLRQPPPGAVVTWAPTSARRRRQRGFDQAELLAVAVARRWRVPCRGLLRRSAGDAQTGLSVAERRRGPSFTVAREARSALARATAVIVIDDVTTTGSTLTAAARALRQAGAPWVGAVTAARRPRLASPRPAFLSVSARPPDVEISLKVATRTADVGE